MTKTPGSVEPGVILQRSSDDHRFNNTSATSTPAAIIPTPRIVKMISVDFFIVSPSMAVGFFFQFVYGVAHSHAYACAAHHRTVVAAIAKGHRVARV